MANLTQPASHKRTAARPDKVQIQAIRIEDVRLSSQGQAIYRKQLATQVGAWAGGSHFDLDSALSQDVTTSESWVDEAEIKRPVEISSFKGTSNIHQERHYVREREGDNQKHMSRRIKKGAHREAKLSTRGNGGKHQNHELSSQDHARNEAHSIQQRSDRSQNNVEVLVSFQNKASGRYWRQWVSHFKKSEPVLRVEKLLAELMTETKKRSIYCQTEPEFELFRNKMKLLIAFANSNKLKLKGLPPVWFFTEVKFWPLTKKERDYHGAIMTFHNRFLKDYYDESDRIFGNTVRHIKTAKEVYRKEGSLEEEREIVQYIAKYTKTEKVDYRAEARRNETGAEKGQEIMNDAEFMKYIGNQSQSQNENENGNGNEEIDGFVIDDEEEPDVESEINPEEVVNDSITEEDDFDHFLQDSFGRSHNHSSGKRPVLANLNSQDAQITQWGAANNAQNYQSKSQSRDQGDIQRHQDKHQNSKDKRSRKMSLSNLIDEHSNIKDAPGAKLLFKEPNYIESDESNLETSPLREMNRICNGLTPNKKDLGEGISQENILLVSGGKGREVQMGMVLERSDPIKEERTHRNGKIVNRFSDNLTPKIQNQRNPNSRESQISPHTLSISNPKTHGKASLLPIEEPTEESPKQSSVAFCFEDDQFESEIELEIEDDAPIETISSTLKNPKNVTPKTSNRINTRHNASKDFVEIAPDKDRKPLLKTGLKDKDVSLHISNRSEISLSIEENNDSKSRFSNDSLTAIIDMEPGELEKALERKISRALKNNSSKPQNTKFLNRPSSTNRAPTLLPKSKNKTSSTIAWERPENTNNTKLAPPRLKQAIFNQDPRPTKPALTKPKPPAFTFVHPNEAQSMLKKIRKIGNSSIQTLSDCQNRILKRLSQKAREGKRSSLQDESSYVLGVIEQALYRLKAQRVDLAGLESTA